MDGHNFKRTTSYDRVMPRVYNRSHSSAKTNSKVTRHDTSSTHIGAKASSSNLSCSVFRELPLVLSGYEPETPVERPRVPKYVTKPRRTVKSLDPGKSPVVLGRNRQESENNRNIRVRSSAPCVTNSEPVGWSDSHLRQCYSSRSHTRLKELKDEIKAFQRTEKLMQLRSHLYKKCGVVLDDTGRVAEDKAVQVQTTDNASGDSILRTERREDARAAVPHQQMRPAAAPYPVDRYLVKSRKQFDMVHVIDDDIWNPEPALRPEDEILLRKLHDMLQTTADDLKLLSGELSKYHEPGVQVKTLPMPLDEEFNEKVHIEEVVNAKFYRNKIVDRTPGPSPAVTQKKSAESTLRVINDMICKNNALQSGKTRNLSMHKQPMKKKLQISRTHTMEIKEKSDSEEQTEKHVTLNNAKETKGDASLAVAYNEFSHKYIQPNIKKTAQKSLQIQEMPSINIRSELKLQNVLQLDILPESLETRTQQPVQQNALVIEMQHEPSLKRDDAPIKFDNSQYISIPSINRLPTRKVSTMTAYESSESNNISSDSQHRLQRQMSNTPATLKSSTLKQKVVSNTHKNNIVKKGTSRSQAYLEEWKRKLNTVYGRPSNTKNSGGKKNTASYRNTSKKSAVTVKMKEDKECVQIQPKSGLNNTEYIPYSKLTLGGVNVSDIEREISNIPNKNNIVLSPILDKILSSRENSFHNDSPKKNSQSKSPKILTTSDENLLQEVLDIEVKVAKTLNINKNTNKTAEKIENNINDSTKDDSYADDFEDEKSDASELSKPSKTETSKSSHNIPSNNSYQEESHRHVVTEQLNKINKDNKPDSNLTFTKAPSLSFKKKVDIFEFIHAVDTQETGTQSNTSNKIAPKETQTSPRCDKPNVQPIHNDLWPSIDPRGEVEKMLTLEKEFIKKLIIDEYGDLLEKSLTKPSTSGKTENANVAASQKITQTSPAHVKSVMTSPTRTKTRTTSPLALSMPVYQQTSPVVAVSNEELKIELENDDDLGISVNLSSPRFSLRLPQTSREVFSKLETKVQNNKETAKLTNLRKNNLSSSSSIDGDYSSSDISSLGELNKKFKRFRKSRIPSISEISSSSSLSKYSSDPSGAILPLRSEGETSIGQKIRRKTNKHSKSEGEVSLGQLR